MSQREMNMEDLLNQSLRISVIKKNIFDISVEGLKREGFRKIRVSVLKEIINSISLDRFRELLTLSKNKEKYSEKLKEIVKYVTKQYLS